MNSRVQGLKAEDSIISCCKKQDRPACEWAGKRSDWQRGSRTDLRSYAQLCHLLPVLYWMSYLLGSQLLSRNIG